MFFFLLAFHCFFHLIEWGLLLSFSSLIEFYRILLALINCDGFFHCFHLFYSVKFSSRFSFSIFSSLRGLAHLIRWNDRLHLFFFFLLFFSRIFFLPDGNRRSCHENQRKNNGVTLEKYSRLAGFLSFITNLLVIFYIWSAFWITTKGITGFNWNSFFLDCILCIFSGFFGVFFYWRLKGFLRFFFFDWVALVLI